MSRFHWPLARLLDVTEQREQLLQGRLFRLSQQIASLHQKIIRRRAAMRANLSDLADQPFASRLDRQQLLMDCLPGERRRLDALVADIAALKAEKDNVAAALKAARTSRESLAKLRERAWQRHEQEQLRGEQRQTDETAQRVFLRLAAAEGQTGHVRRLEPC